MSKFIKNKEVIFFVVFVLFLIPLSGVLAERRNMQIEWPPSPMAGIVLGRDSTITHLVAYLYEWGIALGGLVAFIALIIAGFHYLTSVGDPTKMKEATDRIKSAFLGLALLLGSYLILHTINPELTTLREVDFTPETPGARIIDDDWLGETEPCVAAILFYGINHTDPHIRDLLLRPLYKGKITALNTPPIRSTVICRAKTEEEKEKPKKTWQNDICHENHPPLVEGGACSLQLFDGGWAGWWGCGGPVIDTHIIRIYNTVEILGMDGYARCARLIDRTR